MKKRLDSFRDYNKYLYIIKNPILVKLLYLTGIITWLLTVYGYYHFIKLNPLYWMIIAPFIAVFTIYYIISYGINIFYPGFDVNKHKRFVQKFWGGVW